MADDPQPEPGPPPTPAPAPIVLPDDHPLVKAYAAEKAAAAAARAKVKEFEDQNLSDVERLNAQAAEAVKRAEEAEAKAMRLEVAAAKGLTPAQAKRLAGSTLEELQADADEILEAFPTPEQKPPAADPPPSRKPGSDLKGGTDPTSQVTSSEDIRAAVEAASRGF